LRDAAGNPAEEITMEIYSGYLFKGLSKAQLGVVARIAKERAVEVGKEIFKEGEEAENLFVLKFGAVELTTTVEKGFELPIALLRTPSDILGSSALIPPFKYSLSARCAESSTLLTIGQTDMLGLMKEDHALERAVLMNLAEHFLDRLKETRDELKIHFKILLKSTHS
jgi:CRP/FNR family cyclic AMP-dependent transcriptional regulator